MSSGMAANAFPGALTFTSPELASPRPVEGQDLARPASPAMWQHHVRPVWRTALADTPPIDLPTVSGADD